MNIFFKKSILVTLAVLLIFFSSFLAKVQKAVADVPVIAPATDALMGQDAVQQGAQTETQLQTTAAETGVIPSVAQKEWVWDGIAYGAAKVLIHNLSQSLIEWIQSGFEGSPSFIQNSQSFMNTVADQAIGNFIFGSPLKFLCSPFKLQLQIALGTAYSVPDDIKCTLTDITNNYNNFMGGDFIGGGGWNTWLEVTTQPQNNFLGAMLIAQADLDEELKKKIDEKNQELSWGEGFLSSKNCTRVIKDTKGNVVSTENYTGDPSLHSTPTSYDARHDSNGQWVGSQEETCSISSPGTLANAELKKVFGSEIDQLGLADEFNEIVAASINQLLTMAMIKDGVSGMDASKWANSKAAYDCQNQMINDVKNRLASANNNNYSLNIANLDFKNCSAAGAITFGNPIAVNNPNRQNPTQNQTASIESARSSLLSEIDNALGIENGYANAYNDIVNTITETIGRLNDVIACFNNLNANTNLKSPSISSATAMKNSTANYLNNAQTEQAVAEANIDALEGIITQYNINTTTSLNEVRAGNNALLALSPTLHTSLDLLSAQMESEITVEMIESADDTIGTLERTCSSYTMTYGTR